jgi:hypothetical protein
MDSDDGPASPAPGVGAKGIVLVAAALLVGIVLLNKFDDSSVPFTPRVNVQSGTTTTRRLPSVSIVPSTTLRAPRSPADVKVLVANGTSTTGLATKTADFLRRSNYNSLSPTDATKNLDATIVAYRADYESEARVLAQLLQVPLSAVRPLDDNTPVSDNRGADVVVVAGSDIKVP